MLTFVILISSLSSYALDKEAFLIRAEASIEALLEYDLNKAKIQALQLELVNLAVEGIKTYQSDNTQDKELLSLVASQVEKMKSLSPEEIEVQWHDCGVPEEQGYQCDAYGHFSKVRAYMDAIIHPMTVYILMDHITEENFEEVVEQAIDELDEVIHHLDVF